MRRLLFLLLLTACAEIPSEEGTITPYFCQQTNCETVLLATLANASEISCAFYDLDLASVEELLREKDAAVKLHNRSYGLMHHKFCVLDGQKVITGSMNPTYNGAHKNDNVLLLLESRYLASAYEEEFLHLDTKRAKGTAVHLGGTSIEVCFSPQGDCEQDMLREISLARQSIRFMTFTFTSDPIGDALLDASERGVLVQGVFEKRQGRKYSEFDRLASWGIDVRYDGNPATMHHNLSQSIVYPKLGVLHHKVFIIDNETVITGSYNPTKAANERNDENLLIIHDKAIAREFLDEFDRIWLRASLSSET